MRICFLAVPFAVSRYPRNSNDATAILGETYGEQGVPLEAELDQDDAHN
jgi:hypothetical protein